MFDSFLGLPGIWQALIAGTVSWLATATAATLVFVTKRMSQRLLDSMMGFAAGIMFAASVFSLLIPAIDLADDDAAGWPGWVIAGIGVLLGAGTIRLADAILPHLHVGAPTHEAEGLSTTWRRTTLLVLAITMHNIPEGLAIGVAFGAAHIGAGDATLNTAIALSIGISLQNMPEGLAVALPLRREGVSRVRSFWYGQLSALVEPFAAVTGAAAVLIVEPVLPFALAFAAGAMLFVIVEELIPESQSSGSTDLATLATIVGFVLMMSLDVALG